MVAPRHAEFITPLNEYIPSTLRQVQIGGTFFVRLPEVGGFLWALRFPH